MYACNGSTHEDNILYVTTVQKQIKNKNNNNDINKTNGK